MPNCSRPSPWLIVFAAFLALALGSCTTAHHGPPISASADDPESTCCAGADRYPAWLVRLAEAGAPVIVPVLGSIEVRPGWLERHPDAQALIAARLKPLDIVAVVADGRASLVPALFDHVALYLGDADDVREAGLWDDPRVKPHNAALREGPILIEAFRSGLRPQRIDQVIDVDAVAILRPTPYGRGNQTEAIGRGFGLIGMPFDFRFDQSTTECLFCTEAVMHAMPDLRVPTRVLYGRPTIMPDEMVHSAIVPRTRLRLALYVKADRADWRQATADELAKDLEAAWRRYRGDASGRTCSSPAERASSTPGSRSAGPDKARNWACQTRPR